MGERSERVKRSWDARRSIAKTCNFCKEPFTPTHALGKWCLTCVPDKAALRRANLYSITQAQYEALLGIQANACAICKTSFVGMSPKLIHVDHCHATGRVRGVLCKGCNLGLGWFKSQQLLENAARYMSCTPES